ncbi:trehalose-phosphatase [Salinisphaera sp. LB1]|uniref:trehalose-phosphatase n=1 Tax=Salinisphaera sp. LB1 TaxID=2183911 RepID=UPI000D7086CD|nr:trehalose-phosphatase [Salinisphaera sp. LB1]AWN16862.1 Trehalose-6-phosphate phosphatase [Salinisphaera sp. LB1]
MTNLPAPDESWALFLDVDGTVIDIADHPDSVQPSHRLGEILGRTADALDGALALISGRPIAEIDRLTECVAPAASGLHGLELRTPAAGYEGPEVDVEDLRAARDRLQRLAAEHPALYFEDKQATLALHYRNADDATRQAAERAVHDIVAEADGALSLLAGKAVYEIKPARGDKGRALQRLMSNPPFAGRCPVYVGDDVTDEAAFVAVNSLGGVSVRVGEPSSSAARYRLDTVDEVLEWLEQIATTLKTPSPRPT